MQIRLSFSSLPSLPLTASLFMTIRAFPHCDDTIGLVYSIHDPTAEVAIQKMIDASQRMLDVQSEVTGEPKEGWGINPIMKKHLELEIKRPLKMHSEMRLS
jgi:hypothetical protein